MIEYDENGEEWFGYTLSSDETAEPSEVIATFSGNVHYVEWLCRQLKLPKKCTLADQLDHLFSLLPREAEEAITDDRKGLIRDIVRIRNRYAHGKFEDEPPLIARVHTLSVKVAVLLSFAERVHEGNPMEVLSMARGGSSYLRSQLGSTDVKQS